MASLAQAIMTMIEQALPTPNIRMGVISEVTPAIYDNDDNEVSKAQVLVGGVADQPVPCDWAAGFDLEVSAQGEALVGSGVEVHFIDSQPIIAYSIVAGRK